MEYQTYIPNKRIAQLVRFFYVLEGHVSTDSPLKHRVLANFSPELIFHYGGALKELSPQKKIENTFNAGLHAQTKQVRKFLINRQIGIFGVFFQPYAIPMLFGVPSKVVADELPDLNSLLGHEAKKLEEKIMTAQGIHQRIDIISQFVEHRLKQFERPEIVHACHTIYRTQGNLSIQSLSNKTSLSQRQFQRNFKNQIGFTPKSFAKLVRFRSMLHSYEGKNKTLAEIAYDFGYYDQAHFIHDFKKFSGYSPGNYFSGKAGDVFYAP